MKIYAKSRTISLLIGLFLVTMILPHIVSADTTDLNFAYGKSHDTQIVGDWNGNGIDSIGMFRSGTFYLRNSNTAGIADLTFAYGKTGDIPTIGDWNGDGKDSIGVFRNGMFYLRNSNTAGIADLTFAYGKTGDIPIIGDWNGDGKDSIGVFRNGMFYLRNSNTAGIADLTFAFGQKGDIPIIGDWNGDGKDSIGVYRNGVFYLRNSNTAGNAELAFGFGQSGNKPLAGDWNGNGKDSIGVAKDNLWYMDSNGDGILVAPTSVIETPVPKSGVVSSSSLYLTDFGIKGDGSDETAKLKSALTYAASHSIKAIIFPAGKTIGINTVVETPENLEYIGNGCTIKLVNNAAVNHEGCFIYFHAGSYVHNLIFDGNDANQGGSATNGIMLYTNDRFEDNEVKNVGAYTIYTYKGDNILINNNVIHDTRQYGIGTSGEGFPTVNDYSNNITITNNKIYNCGQVGIKIRQTSNSLVKGNIITIPTSRYDDAPAGIRLYSLDGANNHITITENQISGPGDGSIAISSDDSANSYISITNNKITNANTGIKINFNNGVITGNTITYRSACIANQGSGNTVSGNSCN